VAVVSLLAAFAAAAIGFYFTQNASGRIGGEMAAQKMLWLYYAIVLWLLLPGAVLFDARASSQVRAAYAALFALMSLRAVVEAWMLYVSHNWSPWYGIGHDVACVLVVGFGAVQVARVGGIRSRVDRWLYAHLVVTVLAFVPEVYFAHYMLANFNTAGEAAIYFVPDDPAHREVLRVTWAVVAFFTLYLPVFFWGWILGAAGSRDTVRA
jgi:hypothetical protein